MIASDLEYAALPAGAFVGADLEGSYGRHETVVPLGSATWESVDSASNRYAEAEFPATLACGGRNRDCRQPCRSGCSRENEKGTGKIRGMTWEVCYDA